MGHTVALLIFSVAICLIHLVTVTLAQIEYHVTNRSVVKLSVNGRQGSICAQGYDEKDAQVICRSLGLPDTDARPLEEAYSDENGPVLLNRLSCFGNESSLENCPGADFRVVECPTNKLVKIYCSSAEEYKFRLMSGITLDAGRVEVYYRGEWGTAYLSGDKDTVPLVLCRSLGYPYKMSRYKPYDHLFPLNHIRRGPWIDEVKCNGTESSWLQCDITFTVFHFDIITYRETYISCEDLQLHDGSSTSGRVGVLEGYYQGKWRNVYSTAFNSQAASIACKVLGFPRSGAEVLSISQPDTISSVFLDVGNCEGHARTLMYCIGSRWVFKAGGQVRISCAHVDTNDINFRLVDGPSQFMGRLQVYKSNQWSDVCNRDVGSVEATVACRTLGHDGFKGSVIPTRYVGDGTESIVLHGLQCFGNESNLAECYFNPWGFGTCYKWEVLTIYCGSMKGNFNLRLVDGPSSTIGRVEMYAYGTWFRLCGQMNPNDNTGTAEFVCKELNYPSYNARSTSCFDAGTGVTWNHHLYCTTRENTLEECFTSILLPRESCIDFQAICSDSYVDDKNCFKLSLPTWAYVVLVGVVTFILIAVCVAVQKIRQRKRQAAAQANIPPQRYVVRQSQDMDNANHQDNFELNIPQPQLSDPPPAYDTLFK